MVVVVPADLVARTGEARGIPAGDAGPGAGARLLPGFEREPELLLQALLLDEEAVEDRLLDRDRGRVREEAQRLRVLLAVGAGFVALEVHRADETPSRVDRDGQLRPRRGTPHHVPRVEADVGRHGGLAGLERVPDEPLAESEEPVDVGKRSVESSSNRRRDLPPRDSVPREDLLAVQDEDPGGVVPDRRPERVEEPAEHFVEIERSVQLVRDPHEEPIPRLPRHPPPGSDPARRRRVHLGRLSGSGLDFLF